MHSSPGARRRIDRRAPHDLATSCLECRCAKRAPVSSCSFGKVRKSAAVGRFAHPDSIVYNSQGEHIRLDGHDYGQLVRGRVVSHV